MNKKQRQSRNNEIIRKRLAGQSVQSIAREYQLSREAVYMVLDEAGVKVVPVMMSDDPKRDVEALGITVISVDQVKEL